MCLAAGTHYAHAVAPADRAVYSNQSPLERERKGENHYLFIRFMNNSNNKHNELRECVKLYLRSDRICWRQRRWCITIGHFCIVVFGQIVRYGLAAIFDFMSSHFV